jgi:peptide/nickel transport system ATP-binding protein
MSATPGGALIGLERVTREFSTPAGTIKAVDDISLELAPGEAICLVGESGCGKTTTGRLLAGLLRPTNGVLRYAGADVWSARDAERASFRRAVQLIHQDPYASLNPVRSVEQTLTAPLLHHRKARSGAQARATARSLLERVGLTPAEDFLPKFPHQLSGGQRQRVSIARALTLDPRVIVADEAVSMVDVSIRITLLDLLLGLRDEFGVTVVLITHDLAVARYFGRAGRVAVMYLGRIVELAPTDRLIDDPAHPYASALIAAIPEADPDLTRTKRSVALRSAEVPSLLRLPSGCTFHPRCPLFEAGLCDVRVPELIALDAARSVACHVAVRERGAVGAAPA